MKKEMVNASIKVLMEDGYKLSDWKEDYGINNESYIIRISKKDANSMGIYKLITESEDKFHKLEEKNDYLEIKFFCNVGDTLFSLDDTYEKIEWAKKN